MSAPSSTSRRLTSRPSGPVWWVTSVIPRIFEAYSCTSCERLRHLDAAAFAAAAGMNLRLDHPDFAADFARGGIRLGHRKARHAARRRDAVPAQEFPCLDTREHSCLDRTPRSFPLVPEVLASSLSARTPYRYAESAYRSSRQLHHRTQQCVDLERARGLDVLQHRGLVVAHFLCPAMRFSRDTRKVTPSLLATALRLGHHGRRNRAARRIAANVRRAWRATTR